MLNTNNYQNDKNNKILLVIAIILSLIFFLELALRAYSFYIEALANSQGERNVPDFSNSFVKLRIGIEYFGLNIIYIIWLVINKQGQIYINFTKILKNTSFFLLIAFISYPVTGDINLYVHYGLMDLNKINPFLNAANTFTSSLSPFLAWKQTSTYGPISQLFFMFSAYFTTISPSLGIYVFKLLCLVFHIINSYLIWQYLKISPYRSNVTIAYIISPFMLYEQVTNAHIDVFISTVLIILIICLKKRSYIAAIIAGWIGFLIKTLPIIWLPLIFVYLIKQQRWKSLFIALSVSVAIVIAADLTVLPTVESWESLLNPGVKERVINSIYALVTQVLSLKHLNLPISLQKFVFSIFKTIMFSIFVVSYIIILTKPYFKKNYDETNLSLNLGWITLILFILATPWYCSWYSSVLLAVVALNIHSKRFAITSIILCLTNPLTLNLPLLKLLTVVPALVVILFWFVRDIQTQKKSLTN
ncbi:hypothetical protein WKK05_22900 [Nostoc sp. UHCC 0302]|uniref:hypothetical protein n=1 Tax=Nostoc sp. UHCC 0302 TaxID=3134896 RepID=UPI00311C8ACD